MRSMTGFGQATAGDDLGRAQIQITAVNHRGCQVQLRCEGTDPAFDDQIRQRVRRQLARGSITVQVAYQAQRPGAVVEDQVRALYRHLAALARELGAPAPALEAVVSLIGTPLAQGLLAGHATLAASGAPSPNASQDGRQALLERALTQALDALDAERRREGAALASAFRDQAAALRATTAQMRQAAADRLPRYRQLLTERLRAVSLSDEVALREIAMQAERIDVSEELVRLESHLVALDQLVRNEDALTLDDGDLQGRRLDFLLQEIAREISTTAAKSNDLVLTQATLAARGLVEQMREQAANVL